MIYLIYLYMIYMSDVSSHPLFYSPARLVGGFYFPSEHFWTKAVVTGVFFPPPPPVDVSFVYLTL